VAREKATEICWILETEMVGDLCDRHGGVAQLALSFDQQAQMQHLYRRLTGDLETDAPHLLRLASQSAALVAAD